MPEAITVATGTERVTVDAVARTEWRHDGTLVLLDGDDREIAEFPDAEWATVADHVA